MNVRELFCSEFNEAMRSLADMLDRETPPVDDREAVDRDMRRMYG